jgi:cytoskeletal protein RodZ
LSELKLTLPAKLKERTLILKQRSQHQEKSMNLKASVQQSFLSLGTILYSLPVLAHAGHYQNHQENNQETETNNSSSPKVNQSSPNADNSSSSKVNQSSPNADNSSSSKVNQSSPNIESQEEESTLQKKQQVEPPTQAIEEQATSQSQTVTINQIPAVGETIFGLIVVTPFLLHALRKRISQ